MMSMVSRTRSANDESVMMISFLQEERPEWAELYTRLAQRDAARLADWKGELDNIVLFVSLTVHRLPAGILKQRMRALA